ncbi:hypothetical protein FQZ97_1083670 [compost metagenome]
MPGFQITGVRGVPSVAGGLENRPRCVQRLQGLAQIARNKSDFGFSNGTPRAGHRLFHAESTRRPSQQLPGAREVAELRHRDAA